ncbi:MAG: polysaccharide deacetylase family protein, partial [Bacteroidota bacterium]|nr:polysaccharide deacetylase family protein [Bacteroidota bacterium]
KLLKKKYKIILWDIFAWDFLKKNSSKKIKNNIIKNTTSGSIIVLHNNKKSIRKTHEILTEIIQELKKKKFTFSTTW